MAIETLPATTTGSSTSYFDPRTQRYHDSETKRMVKSPSTGSKVGGMMGSDVKLFNVFLNMQRSLKAIENSIRKLVGMERAQMVGDKFAAGETDVPPPEDDGDEKGGFLAGLKGAFGKGWGAVKSMPNWLKTLGLGALLFWLSKNRDTFAKMLVPLLEWIKETSEYLANSSWGTLKNDFKDKIIKPSLAALGLEMDDKGNISRIQGSWLDLLDPFTGPTNIFKTIKALWQGKNPDTGEWFIPEWMRPWEEQEWVKKITEQREKEGKFKTNMFHTISSLWNGVSPTTGERFLPEWMYNDVPIGEWIKDMNEKLGDPAGNIKSLWEGKNPTTGESFLPEWMTTPIGEMQWFKDTQKYLIDFAETFQGDPVGTIKTLWEGKDPVSGESFLPEWMTKPINETQWYKDTKEYLIKFKDTFVGDPTGTLKAFWEGKDPVSGEPFLPTWMIDPTVLATNLKTFFKGLLPAWMTDDKKDLAEMLEKLDKKLGLPTEDEIEKALKDMMKLIYDPKTGAVFGINFSNLKNMLPSLKDIALAIYQGLPSWMRPDTLIEKIDKLEKAIELQRADAAANPEDKYIGPMLKKMEAELLELQKQLEAEFPGSTDLLSKNTSTLPSSSQISDLKAYGSAATAARLLALKQLGADYNSSTGTGGVLVASTHAGDKNVANTNVTSVALGVDNNEIAQRFYGQNKFFPVATAV